MCVGGERESVLQRVCVCVRTSDEDSAGLGRVGV